MFQMDDYSIFSFPYRWPGSNHDPGTGTGSVLPGVYRRPSSVNLTSDSLTLFRPEHVSSAARLNGLCLFHWLLLMIRVTSNLLDSSDTLSNNLRSGFPCHEEHFCSVAACWQPWNLPTSTIIKISVSNIIPPLLPGHNCTLTQPTVITFFITQG